MGSKNGGTTNNLIMQALKNLQFIVYCPCICLITGFGVQRYAFLPTNKQKKQLKVCHIANFAYIAAQNKQANYVTYCFFNQWLFI